MLGMAKPAAVKRTFLEGRIETKRRTGRPALIGLFSFLALFSLITSGCVTLKDPESSQVNRDVAIGSVIPGASFGQSFQSRRPGLNGVELSLGIDPGDTRISGALTASLYHAPWEEEPLAQSKISLASIAHQTAVAINFPVQNDPPGQSYYLELQSETLPVQVYGRQENVYSAGSAYLDGAPIDADASFSLTYRYGAAALLEDVLGWLARSYLAIPLILVLILPGWLLLDYSGFSDRLDWGVRITLSIGLSLASIPILLLWTTFSGFAWNRTWVIVFFAALVLLAAARLVKERVSPGKRHFDPYAIGLVGVFICALIVRLVMARDLSAPPWVDSVHHGMITRLILESGQLPADYVPFLNIDTAQYHSGFHSALAMFTWLSGLDIASAMLLFGHILNALSIFAVYAFTEVMTQDRRAGLIAAGITAFLTPMPAYLTSWGRYTQLAGLLILPAALTLFSYAFNQHRERDETDDQMTAQCDQRWLLVLAAIASAGLWLVHYRVAAFFAALLLPAAVYQLWITWKRAPGKRVLGADLAKLGAISLLAFILTAPWWPATLADLLLPKLSAWSGVAVEPFADFSWSFLTAGAGELSLYLAGAGLLWGLLNRRMYAFGLIIWVGLLFAIANLGVLGLPGSGFVNNTSVEISLFLPISALGGVFLSLLISWPLRRLTAPSKIAYLFGTGAALVVLGFLGAQRLIPILNPTTMLFRQADRAGLAWVEENVPDGETILINPFLWGYNLYAGSDGGFWSVPLAGRPSLPPPVLYGLGNDPARIEAMNSVIQQVLEAAEQPEELFDLLNTQEIEYVYIGVKGGLLSAEKLLESGLFEPLYQRQDVWVFKTNPEALAGAAD